MSRYEVVCWSINAVPLFLACPEASSSSWSETRPTNRQRSHLLEYTRQIGKKDRGNSHKHDYFSLFFRYTDTWSYEKPCFSGDCERVILFKGVFQHIQEEVILY